MENKYVASELLSIFNEYKQFKQPILQEWRLIRSLYKGQFWQVFKKYLKEYSITPDWNYFEYVVQAYSNSVYSGAFIGTVTPRKLSDDKKVQLLNSFVRYNWSKWGMKNKFLHVGENGELYNLGGIRVDWKNKDILLGAVLPDELYFDPSVDNYKNGAGLFIERSVNIDTLKLDDDFKEGVETYLKEHEDGVNDKTVQNRISTGSGYNAQGVTNPVNNTGTEATFGGAGVGTTSKSRTVSLIECFIRNKDGGIDQIYLLDEETIIYERADIKPSKFPIVCYAPQRPDGNPYGNSKLIKITNTVVALNMIDSMEATQPYRLLNRVRFVNVDGRINMRSFADYGATPGASFEVKGDPKGIIYYEDVPTIPDQSNLKKRLENSIFQVTGVDPQYKGRTTNSLQTTGATQAFQARVTMLTDNSRITMLEEFTEDLTRLVLDFYFEHGGENEYHIPKLSATGTNAVVDDQVLKFSDLNGKPGVPAVEAVPAKGEVPEVPAIEAVPAVDKLRFDYSIAASTLLPMNQANLFESAKALYEMQGQYNFPQRLVTEQDLVKFSDFPQKELWLQRLEKQEQESTAENLISDLTNFASIFSRLLGGGLSEEQAAQQAISVLLEEKNAMEQDPSVGQGFK